MSVQGLKCSQLGSKPLMLSGIRPRSGVQTIRSVRATFRKGEEEAASNISEELRTLPGGTQKLSAKEVDLESSSELLPAALDSPPHACTGSSSSSRQAQQSQALRRSITKLSRKLFTRHDWLRVHTITNGVLFAICVPRTCQFMYEMFVHLNTVAPLPYELPLVYGLAVLRDVSSVPLAFKFRKGNPRMLFLMSAVVDICAWSISAFYMPSYSCIPELPRSVTTAGVLALVLPLIITVLYSAKDPQENVRAVVQLSSAKDRKKAARDPPAKTAAISALYLTTMILPCIFMLQAIIPTLWGGAHVYEYMHTLYPTVQELTYDVTMVGATTAALGVFFNTLKDRRVIGKGTLDILQAAMVGLLLVYVAKVSSSHPDGGVFLTQITNLQFWKPAPWA